MQFFVLEMKQIRDKIRSKDHIEAAKWNSWNRKLCIGIISVSILFGSAIELSVN